MNPTLFPAYILKKKSERKNKVQRSNSFRSRRFMGPVSRLSMSVYIFSTWTGHRSVAGLITFARWLDRNNRKRSILLKNTTHRSVQESKLQLYDPEYNILLTKPPASTPYLLPGWDIRQYVCAAYLLTTMITTLFPVLSVNFRISLFFSLDSLSIHFFIS